MFSTVILLVTYVPTAQWSPMLGSTVAEFEDDAGIFQTLAGDVLPSPLDKLVVFAIITSALASTQTTILPASARRFRWRAEAFPEVWDACIRAS